MGRRWVAYAPIPPYIKVESMINTQFKSGAMTYQLQGAKFVVSPESRDIRQTLQRIVAR